MPSGGCVACCRPNQLLRCTRKRIALRCTFACAARPDVAPKTSAYEQTSASRRSRSVAAMRRLPSASAGGGTHAGGSLGRPQETSGLQKRQWDREGPAARSAGSNPGRARLAAQLVPIAARNNLQTGPARRYANFTFSRRLRRCVDGEGLHVVARVALRAEPGDEGRPRLTPAK